MNIADFNYIESILWFTIALGLLVNSFKIGKLSAYFNICIIAFVAFAIFGISDIIEAQTGAWWRPLGLLVLKVSCVVTFVFCFVKCKKLENPKSLTTRSEANRKK